MQLYIQTKMKMLVLQKKIIENEKGQCFLIKGDVGNEQFCISVINEVIKTFKQINIIVNNAGEQHKTKNITDLTSSQLEKTFKTNVFSAVYMVKAATPHLKSGVCIINTTSITAYN